MQKWINGLLAVIFVCAIFVVPAVFIMNSGEFRYCINQQKENQHTPTKTEDNNSPSFPQSGTYIGCLGQFANTNGNGITAFSTMLLMVITAGLVVVGYMQIRTSRRQLRAYIFVETSGITDGATHPGVPNPVSSGCPNYAVLIRNYGQTPAYNVRHLSQIDICPTGQEGRLRLSHMPEMQIPPSSIGPNGTTTSMHNLARALTPFEIQALSALGQALIVHGRITYKDAFGVRHTTEYMLGYSGPYPPAFGQPLIFANTGNKAD